MIPEYSRPKDGLRAILIFPPTARSNWQVRGLGGLVLKQHPSRQDCEFAESYIDAGISTTNTKYFDGFNRMIAGGAYWKYIVHCHKALSLFGRNTMDQPYNSRKAEEKWCGGILQKERFYWLQRWVSYNYMYSLDHEECRSIFWGKKSKNELPETVPKEDMI